jgi:hypothetical protein
MAKAFRTEEEHAGDGAKPSSDLSPALLALLEFIGEQIAHDIIEKRGVKDGEE